MVQVVENSFLNKSFQLKDKKQMKALMIAKVKEISSKSD
jgi:hypothetical protein